MFGLYVHIPFCESKCKYCDFYSETNRVKLVRPYINALKIEAGRFDKSTRVDTVFIGGGNPACIPLKQLEEIFKLVHSFNTENLKEFSVEANPENVNKGFLDLCADYNVTRLSLGVQSFNEQTLKILGRKADNGQVLKALNTVKEYNKFSFNIDLIFNIPGQTLAQFQDDLKRVFEIGPNSLSAYGLMLTKGTAMANEVETGKLSAPCDELYEKMYRDLYGKAYKKGYQFYEVSNFAKPGFECLHNEIYWKRGQYAGMGASASGYIKSKRYTNISGIDRYINKVITGQKFYDEENLDNAKIYFEYVMLGLRTKYGVNIIKMESLYNAFSQSGFESVAGKVNTLLKQKYIKKTGNVITCTIKGLLAMDGIINYLM